MAGAGIGVIDDLDEILPARDTLLEQLQETPAGPKLATLLASVDRSSLDPEGLLRLTQARQRLIAHQEAQLLADLHAVARAVPDYGPQGGRRDTPGRYPWAEVELASALRWTHPRAVDQLVFADEVIDRLPTIHQALTTGAIDIPRAWVMVEAVSRLDDDLARAIIDQVIDHAPRLTTGQLRARLRRLVLAADPDAATKRARHDVKDRRVAAYPQEHNHLATLAGYDLAPHRVAAVMERLDAIAKAAKAAGDTRKMDQLRADVYLDLLTGDGIAAGRPITHGEISQPDATVEPAAWPATPADPDLLAEPETEPDPAADPDQAVDLWAFGITEPPDEHDDTDVTDVEQQDWLLPSPATTGPGALPAPRRGVVELQVPLATLIGWSQLPGELAGFAPVVADIARQVAQQMRDATWKWSAYDALGRLAYHGLTHERPTVTHHTGRHPSAEQAGFVKARDRTCVAPGCRRSARMCDIDHTLAWVKGGETETCNLGLLCRLHHLFKHSLGCELLQLSSGTFAWKFPSGLEYVTRSDTPLIDDNQLTGLPKPDTVDRRG